MLAAKLNLVKNENKMPTTAFLTDSTLCIGCKACEVACKEWNGVAEDGLDWSGFSYDNTGAVGHSTWRHVKFVEMTTAFGVVQVFVIPKRLDMATFGAYRLFLLYASFVGVLHFGLADGAFLRWAGRASRSIGDEWHKVGVQPDICNGCGYCVVACPFGVVERNNDDGRAFKCTFCYDRQRAGLVPACAKACPTESIKFGEISDLQAKAEDRVQELRRRGMKDATLYDAAETSVGGTHAIFILRGDPRSYNLPPRPEIPTIYLKKAWTSSAVVAGALLVGSLLAFLMDRRD